MKIKKHFIQILTLLGIIFIFKNIFFENYLRPLLLITGEKFENIGFVIYYFDVFVIIGLFFLLLVFLNWWISSISNNIKNDKTYSLILTLCFAYIILRFVFIEKNQQLNYALYSFDFVICIIFCCICFLFFRTQDCFKKELKNNSKLYIQTISPEQTIDFERIAIKAAERCNGYFGKAFIMTFTGEYGLGKTTLLERIQSKLDSNKTIKVFFVPSNYNSTESLIKDFFNTFSSAISPNNPEISSILSNYAAFFIPKDYGDSFSKFMNLFTSNDSLAQYEKINDIIERTEKTIVFFIDDLDRLQKEEILVVLKLIRNISNFKNTVFVTAYDISIVLKKGQFDQVYLEKYTNLTYTLPIKENYTLEYFIKDLFLKQEIFTRRIHFFKDKTILEFISKPFENYLYNTEEKRTFEMEFPNSYLLKKHCFYSEVIIADILKNYREITSFYNSFLFQYELMLSNDNCYFNPQEYFVYKLLVFKFSWIQKIINSTFEPNDPLEFISRQYRGEAKHDIAQEIIFKKFRKRKRQDDIDEKIEEGQKQIRVAASHSDEQTKTVDEDYDNYNIILKDYNNLSEEDRTTIDKSIKFLFSEVDDKFLARFNPYSIRCYSFYKMYDADNSYGVSSISELIQAIKEGSLELFFSSLKERYANDNELQQILSDYAILAINYIEFDKPFSAYSHILNLNDLINKYELSLRVDSRTRLVILSTKLVERFKEFDLSKKIYDVIASIIMPDNNGSFWQNSNLSGFIIDMLNILGEIHKNEFLIYLENDQVNNTNNIYTYVLSLYLKASEYERKDIPLKLYKSEEIDGKLIGLFLLKLGKQLEKQSFKEITFTCRLLRKQAEFSSSKSYLPFQYRRELRNYIEENFETLINSFDFENQLVYNYNPIGIAIANRIQFDVYINVLDSNIFSPDGLDNSDFETYNQYIMQGVDNYIEFLENSIAKMKSPKQISKVKYMIDVINLCGRRQRYYLSELNEIRSRYGYFPIELKDD